MVSSLSTVQVLSSLLCPSPQATNSTSKALFNGRNLILVTLVTLKDATTVPRKTSQLNFAFDVTAHHIAQLRITANKYAMSDTISELSLYN